MSYLSLPLPAADSHSVFRLGQTLYSITATRMVLNLRRKTKSGDRNGGVIAAEIALEEVSNVQFARRSTFGAGMSYVTSYDDRA